VAMNRRELLTGLGTVAAAATGRSAAAFALRDSAEPFALRDAGHSFAPGDSPGLPRKSDFAFEKGVTYISGAFTHPMPAAAADAYREAIVRRSTVGAAPLPMGGGGGPRVDPRAAFAALINARPSEVGYIPNTSAGENLVVECLGIAKFDGNVVTDALHFEGALVHLMELGKQGLDLRVVAPRDGRIDMADLERVVDRRTKLVELSLVSMYNGFQHDLKAVCDLAHAHGAYVYADIIQAAGAVPIDVRASGVDFAACATYKWLMGDFGLGFLYVREDLLGTVVRRPHWSYRSASDVDIHLSPFDPESAAAVTWTPRHDASGYFELGTVANAVAAALSVSLPYIQRLGVDEIERYRQPMLKRLQDEMPRLGFTPATPRHSTSPIVTFASRDTRAAARKLEAAKVNVRVAPYWIRIAPSIYNDMQDVERLLDALA
jgi:selenocysteine lyase/cysteine desulfurase